LNIEHPTLNIEVEEGEDREEFTAKVAKEEGNFKFWILNEEEREEVAFCCDLRSMIYYLFFFCCRRTWSRILILIR